ncbi:MAG: right-handed parallel beta-helix repeat-containing protein [Phycisphaerae bacterium]
MKSLAHIAVLSVLVLAGAQAVATDVSGDQSGTWTLDGSPYNLVGDVRVPPGETLVIEPGVEVIGQGHYKLTVDAGTLLAVGTADQPILVTATDHATGWRGIRLESAHDSSTISYCIIEYARGTGAYPEVRGGAIYCQYCSPTISNNELRFNYSHNANYNGTGAGVTTEFSSAWVVNNYIHDNTADSGAGVCCMEYGTPKVARNVIVDNEAYYAGGGIYMGARSSPIIENNVIMRNTSGGWGGGGINSWTSFIFYGTFATVRNNLIAQNTATSGAEACGGGGVYCRYDRCLLTNNTIADNQAPKGGGIYAINYPPQAPIVTNCIAWGNSASTGDQIYLYPDTSSAISVAYTDVEDGWPGTGNMNDDPLFADPLSDDYHLTASSPCIDTGDPAFVPQPGETDIDGQVRVWDGDDDGQARVDMGADEFDSRCPGDLDGDGDSDLADLAQLLANYGTSSGAGYEDGDLDDDDDVDLNDLAMLLAVYGTGCL